MNKKAKRLKRYIYISQRKIDMFDQQSDANLLQQLAGTLQSWLLTTKRIKVKDIELERPSSGDPSLHSKLTKILDRLEKEHGNEIGTVDTPAEYIRDTLPMFYRLIPSRPNYRRLKNDPGFVYFSGNTEHTVIALVGSPFHLLGRAKDASEEPSSDLPLLVAYINERLGEIVDDYYKEKDHGLLAIQHAGNNNEDPRIPMEFFAYRILDSADIKGMHPRKRILLYTPLYVAYASDNSRKP